MEILKLLDSTSKENLEKLYKDPYIIRAFKQDKRDFKPLDNPLVKYYSAFIDDTYLGSFMFINFSYNEIEAHSMLNQKGIIHSRELGRMFLEECFSSPKITRVTTMIPSDLITAINYVKKCGFKEEGIKRDSIYRNNKLLNNVILGITRKDFYE